MNPKFYLVGGAVRDHVLGRESNDRDYVVVGSTPEWMIEHGYSQVGATFPVFLHPETGAEYALARQERKNGVGYTGFEVKYDPNVTLEDDLLRRDLTINSMAMTDNGQIIDPWGGLSDLTAKILRHTSEAFADDPLRVLRVARFAARYPDFSVDPGTIKLMKKIVNSGELKALPNERIWSEIHKGLKELNPSRMFKVLYDCGALNEDPLKNYVDGTFDEEMIGFANNIFEHEKTLSVQEKFLIMLPIIGSITPEMAHWLKIPTDYYRLSQQILLFDEALCSLDVIDPDQILDLINSTRYDRTLNSGETKCILHVLDLEEKYGGIETNLKENLERLNTATTAVNAIDMKIALAGCDKKIIKYQVQELKLKVIQESLSVPNEKTVAAIEEARQLSSRL